MRKIIDFFIESPKIVNLLILVFFCFGYLGFNALKSSFFPLIPSKTVYIDVSYPGASPQEIEEGIILKIEDQLKGIRGIERVTSVSKENSGNVRIELETGEDINNMLQDIKNAVDQIPSFPTGMEPVTVGKQEVTRSTMLLSVNGENVSLKTLKKAARNIENDFRKIDGISQVEISGFPKEEIEVAINKFSLKAYNVTFPQVSEAIKKTNILITGGSIKSKNEEYLIRAKNRTHEDEIIGDIIISSTDGKIVRVKDVAKVTNRFSEQPEANYFNGNVSVNIEIKNTINEDLISAAEKITKYVSHFNETHDIINIDILSNRSIPLKQRTQLLAENALAGILLVLLFLSLFLNTRLAFWVAFGLPISFFGMFIFLSELDVTINVLSLFGMIIVIGILVDDGIVIAENIYQRIEKGDSPKDAAINGTLEVLPSVISAVATTILAFSIFFFLDSRIGEFFSEISVVVILTLSISLIEALILLPTHLAHSKALAPEKQRVESNRIAAFFFGNMRKTNKMGSKVMGYLRDKVYSPVLKFCLNNILLSFSLFFMLLFLTIGAIGGGIIRTTFFPRIASDRVSVTLNMPRGTTVEITDSIIRYIEKVAWIVNDEYTEKQTGNQQVIQNITRRIGPGSSNASLRINLLPGEDRDFSSAEITQSLRKQVGPVYGTENLVFGSGGNFGGSPISISLLGNNIEELKAAKNMLKQALNSNSQLKDINDNDPEGIKEIQITLNSIGELLGFDLSGVMSQIRAGFFGLRSQRFQKGKDELQVWIRYDSIDRNTITDLDDMKLYAPNGSRVPFHEIANYQIKRGEVSINHLDGLREIQVNADLTNPKSSALDILNQMKKEIIPNIISKYPSVSTSYEGQNREAIKLQRSAKKIVPIVLMLIYLVIAFTFNSYIQPILLFLMVPFSIIGVGWGHWIQGFPINILSSLGIIAMIGIMVNDGLVLINRFNKLLKEGLGYEEALYLAGMSRFRAIFLTSLTTIAGLTPLLFEKSRQAQFLKPMAISVSYGIGIATVLTLLMLPMLLLLSHKARILINRMYVLFK